MFHKVIQIPLEKGYKSLNLILSLKSDASEEEINQIIQFTATEIKDMVPHLNIFKIFTDYITTLNDNLVKNLGVAVSNDILSEYLVLLDFS